VIKKDKSEYQIQSVSNALDILEFFQGEEDEISLSEFSKRLKIQKNTTVKLLATLEFRGYIDHNKTTDDFRLGLKTLELRRNFIYHSGLKRRSRPVLENLVKECNESSYISLLKDFSIIYLDCVETDMIVRVVSRIGSWLPAYCTAAGKSQIAYMSEDELDKHLHATEFRTYTANTITDGDTLKQQLRQIAIQGYAINNEEMEIGVKGVSAPIRDYTQRIIGAVSISGPSSRFSTERMENELIPLVLKAAMEISGSLGFKN